MIRNRGQRVSKAFMPLIDSVEERVLLSASPVPRASSLPAGYYSPAGRNYPVVPVGAEPEIAGFVDPTTKIDFPKRVGLGRETYIGPFVNIVTGRNTVLIGDGADVQDNVFLDARRGSIVIGAQDVVAHGSSIIGPANMGGDPNRPSFVGFNAVVDGATIEPGAYLSAMARISPGIVLHTGMKALPGVYLATQAEADDPALGKVVVMTQADIDFINGVLYVNQNLAEGYSKLFYENPKSVRGIGPNPVTDYNPNSVLPEVNGKPRAVPRFRNRIIGQVSLVNTVARLTHVLGLGNSVRADEGFPFNLGPIRRFGNRVTMHALEETGITTGKNLRVGFRNVIHGGADIPNADPDDITVIGDDVQVRNYSVVFRSIVGNNVKIGNKVYLDKCNLADGTVVPDGTVMIENVVVRTMQW